MTHRPHLDKNKPVATVPAADIYSPQPNILERRFAAYLAQRGAYCATNAPPSRACVQSINRVSTWVISLSALAGIISGGLIGGAEIWMRQSILDGMDDAGWQATLPYWSVFYIFVGVISAIEIALLYALALGGIARVTQHSGLALAGGREDRLFAHSLARTALEFPSPQILIYGIDPYAYVSSWKLMARNIAYKLKVGVSSFILRVFLRRVAARMAIRGMVPLFAGPLYAAWNAYIIWRIMTEARVRTLGPFAADNLIAAHFRNTDDLGDTEKDVSLHAAGEMLIRGRDAHPNHIYLITRLRSALDHHTDLTPDWSGMRGHLARLDTAGRTRILDLLTVSCVIGARIHRDQMALLRDACRDCGATLDEDRVYALRKALKRGQPITGKDLSATRQ
ncbi:MAG: hypothetical protein JJU08_12315 [Rhodobacteraceae bacterium]|nr:hypothetical protein [Paracoccaceae bacterium]